jgi:hypothetical protein
VLLLAAARYLKRFHVDLSAKPRKEGHMSQVNITPNGDEDRDARGARTAATNNLTWAIAMILVIAAIAIAIVFVAHSLVHLF